MIWLLLIRLCDSITGEKYATLNVRSSLENCGVKSAAIFCVASYLIRRVERGLTKVLD